MPVSNFYADIPDELPQEFLEQLAGSDGVRIERIVSRGHSSPARGWYDQEQHEWVLLLRGSAVISYPGKPDLALGPGDYVSIAPHEKHRVAWTTPDEDTIWLAVHY